MASPRRVVVSGWKVGVGVAQTRVMQKRASDGFLYEAIDVHKLTVLDKISLKEQHLTSHPDSAW